MAGEHCSTGCLTRDHETWGECVAAKHFRPMWLGGTGPSAADQRTFERNTDLYRQAVRDGCSLSTAMNKGVEAAYREAGKG